MDIYGFVFDTPLRVDINVKVIAGQAAINQFHTAYFYNAMTVFGVDPRGFSIQDYLSLRHISLRSYLLSLLLRTLYIITR